MDKLSFGSFNSHFKPSRTDFDWLNRDQAEVDLYIQDKFCGFLCSAGFFCDFLEAISFIHNPQNQEKIPKDLPICFLSGEQDPVGGQGKGVVQVYQAYQKAGVQDVNYKLYPEARHEIMLEINRKEVYQDAIQWLKQHLSTK